MPIGYMGDGCVPTRFIRREFWAVFAIGLPEFVLLSKLSSQSVTIRFRDGEASRLRGYALAPQAYALCENRRQSRRNRAHLRFKSYNQSKKFLRRC